MTQNPFEGKVFWWRYVEGSYREMKKATPNIDGVFIRGSAETSPILEEFYDQGLEAHKNNLTVIPWFFWRGDNFITMANTIINLCDLVHPPAIIINSEPWSWKGNNIRVAQLLDRVKNRNPDLHIALCLDAREWNIDIINIDAWLSRIDSLHPMAYWQHFDDGSNAIGCARKLHGNLNARSQLPVYPVFQTYPGKGEDNPNGQPVSPSELYDGINDNTDWIAQPCGCSLYRWGDNCSTPEITLAVNKAIEKHQHPKEEEMNKHKLGYNFNPTNPAEDIPDRELAPNYARFFWNVVGTPDREDSEILHDMYRTYTPVIERQIEVKGDYTPQIVIVLTGASWSRNNLPVTFDGENHRDWVTDMAKIAGYLQQRYSHLNHKILWQIGEHPDTEMPQKAYGDLLRECIRHMRLNWNRQHGTEPRVLIAAGNKQYLAEAIEEWLTDFDKSAISGKETHLTSELTNWINASDLRTPKVEALPPEIRPARETKEQPYMQIRGLFTIIRDFLFGGW